MDFTDSPEHYRDLFNRSTLELTCKMLRKKRPSLALRVQNALVVAYPRNDYHTGLAATELPLSAEVARQIVQALSALSDEMVATGQANRAELVLIRSLLLDWLMFAREQHEEQPAA